MNSKKIILTIGIAALLLIGVIGIALLFAPPRLTFSLELDGKPLSADRTPVVKVDGQPFVSGSKLGVGQHAISVSLPNAEPFNSTVWLSFGSKNLGPLRLVSVTGAINVSTYPTDCKVTLRQGGAVVGESMAPAHFTKLLLGGYDLEVEKSGSKEASHIVIDEAKPRDIEVKLKLGQVALSSVPADSEYTLSGGGRNWDGHLPLVIQDVPVGNYELTVRRKGWEMRSELEVQLGKTATNQTVFTYGTISILSDPAGMNILSKGVSIGKSPVKLDEARPGKYVFSASDGENELSTSFTVEPNQQTNHLFIFRYGVVRLTSTPTGATVIRSGKDVGKTPLTLEQIPVGDISVELRLAGYLSTNFPLQIRQGEMLDLAAKLINERYLQTMKEARERFEAGKFDDSRKLVAVALEIEPGDANATKLQGEISETERKAKAQEMASLAWLDFQQVISDCTDTKQVQSPVQKYNITYEPYRDSDGKYKQREVKSAPYTVMETKTESTFNDARFAAKYMGKTYKFDSTGWKIAKIEKDGTIAFRNSSGKALDFGQVEIRAIPSAANQGKFLSVKDSQQITIKARIKSHDRGDFLSRVLQRIQLEDAEIFPPINSQLSNDLNVIQSKEVQQATEIHVVTQSDANAKTNPEQAGEKSEPSATDVTLHSIVINNRWGFADKSGKIMINPQFDAATEFSEGMAVIKLNRRFGFIDNTGRIVINPQFENASSFSGGLAAIRMSGRWGFIDKTGKVIINPQFDQVESFTGGRARVKNGTKIGYIDATGNYVSNP